MSKKKKILLIDDEESICRFTKFNLESTGKYEVMTAASGEEGLKKAKELSVDLVITDFRMSGMNGEEVIEELKKKKPELPIFLFSIYHDDQSTITPMLKSKADGLLSKPIDFEQLHKMVEGIIEKSDKK